jgi:hypothetical protein
MISTEAASTLLTILENSELLDHICLDDYIGCTGCGARITIRESSRAVGGGRICTQCHSRQAAELDGIDPPY